MLIRHKGDLRIKAINISAMLNDRMPLPIAEEPSIAISNIAPDRHPFGVAVAGNNGRHRRACLCHLVDCPALGPGGGNTNHRHSYIVTFTGGENAAADGASYLFGFGFRGARSLPPAPSNSG